MEKRSLYITIVALLFFTFQYRAKADDFCLEQAEKAVFTDYVNERDLNIEYAENFVYDFVSSAHLTETEYVYVLTLIEKFPDGLSETSEIYEVHLDQATCRITALFKRN